VFRREELILSVIQKAINRPLSVTLSDSKLGNGAGSVAPCPWHFHLPAHSTSTLVGLV